MVQNVQSEFLFSSHGINGTMYDRKGRKSSVFRSTVFYTSVGLILLPNWRCLTLANAFTITEQSKSHKDKRVVFGTAALSKAENPLKLLDCAYEKGFCRFDLARTYGAGESERIFGEWMDSRNIDRNSVNIITKGGMGKDKYGSPYRPLLTREELLEEVDSSLESLKTDFVEMYMFHRDDPRISSSTFVDWANEIVRGGKAKSWGVSNWSFDRFREAHEYATFKGLVPPTSNSPQFSLAIPRCEVWPTTHSISGHEYAEQIAWYGEHDIELLCWEVLAKGFMASEDLWKEDVVDPSTFYSPVEEGSDEWRTQRIQRAYCHEENYRRRNAAVNIAKKFGLTLSQVTSAYPLSVGKHISIIFGTTKPKNLDDMVEVGNMRLDEVTMSELLGKEKKKVVSASGSGNKPVAANNVKEFKQRVRESIPMKP